MTLGQRIKQLREEQGLTQGRFSELIGVSKSAIGMYETDKREPNLETLDTIADYFNVDMDYLRGKSDCRNKYQFIKSSSNNMQIPEGFIPLPKTYKVPLVGNIACGVPILAEENIEGSVEVPDNIRADFALRCKGDSMIGVGIRDEDIVYIRKTSEVPRNGQIVAVRIEDEATLKRFYLDGSDMRLVAENPSVPTLYYSGSQLDMVSVEGIAVGYTHKIKE